MGGAEPGITYLGITERDITESGGNWKVGNRYNGNPESIMKEKWKVI